MPSSKFIRVFWPLIYADIFSDDFRWQKTDNRSQTIKSEFLSEIKSKYDYEYSYKTTQPPQGFKLRIFIKHYNVSRIEKLFLADEE